MNSSRPSMCIRAAKNSDDGWVWFANVVQLPKFAVGIERVPAKDILAYAKRGFESTAPKRGKTRPMGLVGYLDGLRRNFGGVLYVLDDPEELDQLRTELQQCQSANEKREHLIKATLSQEKV